MKEWILWLDDLRPAPKEGPFHTASFFADLPWTIARSTKEALDLVEIQGLPIFMSLDHDLGGEDTVMEFLKALADRWDGKSRPPEFKVHSANPVGRENIIAFMRSWHKVADLAD